MAALSNFKVTSMLCIAIISNIANASFGREVEDIARYSDGDMFKLILSKMEDMQAKIKKLEKSESSLKESVGVLIGTTAQFRLQIADLTKKLEEFEQSSKEKEERIEYLEEELARSGESNDVNTDRHGSELIAEEKARSVRKEGGVASERGIRQTPEQVAFSAYLDHIVRNLGHDQPIVYNMILLNEAGAYSGTTGIFHVPVPGVYLFSWSVTGRKLPGEQTHEIWLKLFVNGVHKVDAVAESQVERDDNQGSNTVILRLKHGDEVWTAAELGNSIYGADNERTTSFAGVLLYAD